MNKILNFYLFLIFCLTIKTIHLNKIEASVKVTSDETIDVFWNSSSEPEIKYIEVVLISKSWKDHSSEYSSTFSVNETQPVKISKPIQPGGKYEIVLKSVDISDPNAYQREQIWIDWFTTRPRSPIENQYFDCYYSERSITIKLNQPSNTNLFEYYRVTIEPSNSSSSIQTIEAYNNNSAVFEELIPGRKYKITIQTCSDETCSPNTISKPAQLTCHLPPLPPSKVWYDPRTLTTNSFDIIWDLPSSPPGHFTDYVIKKNGTKIKTIPMSDPQVVSFYNQTAGQTHQISVQTSDGFKLSKPFFCNVTTRPLPLSSLIHKPGNSSDILLEWTVSPESTQDSFNVSFWETEYSSLKSESVRVINKTSCHLLDLLPGRNYSIAVTALSHNISSIPPTIVYQPTQPSPPYLIYFPEPISDGYLNVTWKHGKHSSDTIFKISPKCTKSKFGDFSVENTSYKFKIYPDEICDFNISAHMLGLWSEPRSIHYPGNHTDQKSPVLIIMIIMSSLILIIVVIISGLFFYKRHNNSKEKKVPLFPTNNGTSDELPGTDLFDQEYIIEISDLKLGNKIGEGHYGVVFRGEFSLRKGRVVVPVAIKLSNAKQTGEDKEEFLGEAFIMKTFNHPNIVKLIGVSFESNGSPLVVLPLMKNGDLLTYIQSPENSPTVKQLIRFAIDVAKGMEYLSDQHFIHRDLAARNCLLDEEPKAVVSDFGLTKPDDIYKSIHSKPMPIKWMAIESIESGIYTTMSDVWSYGVLVWELMSRGRTPYLNIDNLLAKLKGGYRLPKPIDCPQVVYAIIKKCWSAVPEDRPSFNEIKSRLEEIYESSDSFEQDPPHTNGYVQTEQFYNE